MKKDGSVKAPHQSRVGGGNRPYLSVSYGSSRTRSSRTYRLIVVVEDPHTGNQFFEDVLLRCLSASLGRFLKVLKALAKLYQQVRKIRNQT